jgi:peptidoglycan/LPS O-acetylase OafA/YrhL
LRAIAILLVMSFHYELDFIWLGRCPALFFVLSGFLITRILWKEKFKPKSPLWPRFKKILDPANAAHLSIVLRVSDLPWDHLSCSFVFPSITGTFIPYLATYTINYTRLMPGWLVNPLFTHLVVACRSRNSST